MTSPTADLPERRPGSADLTFDRASERSEPLPDTIDRVASSASSCSPDRIDANEANRNRASAELPRVEGYEILDVLGRGGMGVVYRARQVGLGRMVALKMILSGDHAGEQDRVRFKAEAAAVARLQHPGIVQIYEVGETGGHPFFSLEFVEGTNLAAALKGMPQTPVDAATLTHSLAEAMHYAHERGIVHRDLKPANILLSGPRESDSSKITPSSARGRASRSGGLPPSTLGTPKITDFGLAKQLGDPSGQTQTGSILGTPSYMAPEQAAGRVRDIGPAADTYALGAVLYELLTGRPPFRAATMLDTLEQVRTLEPVPPRRLEPKLSRDLETICLKCLQKEPMGRYASAAALADDLRRFLEGEPILARPVGRTERVYRWSRRNPVVAGLLATVWVALLAGTVVSTYFGRQAAARAKQAEKSRDDARIAEGKARGAEDRARKSAGEATQSEALALAAKRRSDVEAARLKFREAIGQAQAGAVDVGLYGLIEALQLAPRDDEAVPFRRALCASFAAWSEQLPTLRFVLDSHGEVIVHTIGNDERFFATWRGGRDLKVYATDTGMRLPDAPIAEGIAGWKLAEDERIEAISPDGDVFLTRVTKDGHEWSQLRRAMTGGLVGEPSPLAESHAFQSLFLVPGLAIAGVEGNRRFWDLTNDKWYPLTLASNSGVSLPIALSQEGKPLAVVFHAVPRRAQGTARLEFWDISAGTPAPFPLRLAVGGDPRVADERTFATVDESDDRARVTWWDLETGRRIDSWQPRFQGMAALSDDTQTLFSGANERLRLFDLDTGYQLGGDLPGPKAWNSQLGGGVMVVGQPVLFANFEDHLRAWNTQKLSRLATADANAGARLFGGETAGLGRARKLFQHALVSPGGKFAFLNVTDPGVDFGRLVDVASRRPIGPPLKDQRSRSQMVFSPDDRMLATAPFNYLQGAPAPEVHLYDTANGQRRVLNMPTFIMDLEFSSDNRTLAVGQIGGTAILDVETGEIRKFLSQKSVTADLAFSPDGKRLAVAYRGGWGGEGSGFRLWNVATGEHVGPFYHFRDYEWDVPEVHFVGNGRFVLVLDMDRENRLHVFDGLDGTERDVQLPQASIQLNLAARSRGAVFAFESSNVTVEQWDVDAGQAVGEPMVHPLPVDRIEFSPDERLLATVCRDNSLRLWDSATGLPLGPPRLHAAPVLAVRFASDNLHLVSASAAGEVRVWPLPEAFPDDPDRLGLWIEAASGRRLLGEETTMLDPDTWRQRRRELRECWPQAADEIEPPRGNFTAERAAWHHDRASDAEATGNTYALLWHLDRLSEMQPADWHFDVRRGEALADAGKSADADAAYSAAGKKNAGEALADSYRHGAARARSAQRWDLSGWYLERLISARPDDWQAFVDRAELDERLGKRDEREADLEHAVELGAPQLLVLRLADEQAHRGEWSKAAGFFKRARDLGPLPLNIWHQFALVSLELDDMATYRQICTTLMGAAAAAPPPPEVAHAIGAICVLGPKAVDDEQALVVLAESAMGQAVFAMVPTEPAAAKAVAERWHSALSTLGAVLFRVGRHTEAVARLEEGIKGDQGGGAPLDFLFLALCHRELGDLVAANHWFEKFEPPPDSQEGDRFWTNLESELLRREVEARIQATP